MNFKKFYNHINFDVDRPILSLSSGKQGDTGSRGSYVTVVQNNTVVDNLVNTSMKFYFEKPDGTRGEIAGVKEGNKFRIDYTNQVYAVAGNVSAELRLLGDNGEKISSKTFTIKVSKSIADGSIISKDERGILDQAFELAEELLPRIELLDIELLEDLQGTILELDEKVEEIDMDVDLLKTDVNSIINIMDGLHEVKSWKGVQAIVRNGMASKFFKIGDQFVTDYDGVPYVVEVIGIDHDVPANEEYQHSMTIQFRDCLANVQVSAAQALYYADTELLPGTHVYTQDGTNIKYEFTTTQPIPVGGQVFISSADEYIPLKVTTYEADRVTAIETVDVIESTKAETLSEVNVRVRCRYGSNNYMESAMRQWLNSDAENFEWEPQTKYDRPSTASVFNSGFLHRLDPELAEVIGPVKKQVARNTVTDGGGQDTFEDKVFLLSRVEVYGGSEGAVTGETPYEFYANMASAPTASAIDGRIKLLNNSPRYWWLRSPSPGNAGYGRSVHLDGAVSGNVAVSALGLSPACVIY